MGSPVHGSFWPLACAYVAALAVIVLNRQPAEVHRLVDGIRIFTKAELATYDGIKRRETYLAIMGQVFDVTNGSQFYAQRTGGYDFFATTDGSLAFITGDFENNVTDDVSELSPSQLYHLATWVNQTYHTKYAFKGRLEGYFYDIYGRKTTAMRRIDDLLAQERIDIEKRKQDERLYPKCNAKRARGVNLVWCRDDMVPRRRTVYGGQERCACFRDPEAAADDPHNALYPGCPPQNSSCARGDS